MKHPIVGTLPRRTPLLTLSGGVGLSGCTAFIARKHCEQVMSGADSTQLSECIGKRVETYNGWIHWFGDLFLGAFQAITAVFS